MRNNSPKQAKASRENGAKSKGPISKTGMNKAAQNSIKDGVFSRGIVIARLGEKREDFDRAKQLFWDFFQPSNSVEEMLISDFVENWWRRERVRHAEELELQSRLDLSQLEGDLRRFDQVQKLRLRFALLFRDHVIGLSSMAAHDIPSELQDVRAELAATVEGIDFLILLISGIKPFPKETKKLTPRQRALLDVISGFGNEGTSYSLVLDPVGEIFRARGATSQGNQRQMQSQPSSTGDSDITTKEEVVRSPESHKKIQEEDSMRGLLRSVHIDIVLDELNKRKQRLRAIQESEGVIGMAMGIIDPRTSERFSRAETQAERRMYRALSALALMRSQSSPDLIPPKPKLQNEPELSPKS